MSHYDRDFPRDSDRGDRRQHQALDFSQIRMNVNILKAGLNAPTFKSVELNHNQIRQQEEIIALVQEIM